MSENDEEEAKKRGMRIERLDWLCTKVQNIDERTKHIDDRVPDDHEERLEHVEQVTNRHSWYWRGFTGIITFIGTTAALAWKQISHLIMSALKS